MELNATSELIEDIRQGKMVILMDDEDRENEGDLIIAAEHIRPEDINFMARHACGLICLTLTPERCKQLRLPLMVHDNHAKYATNFTVSIEAASGVTTGISAADRAATVQAAVAANAGPDDIVQPGHIFPLMAQPGGVLNRSGHTEAGCDLARLAGCEAAAVIVEIMNPDGSMARRPDLEVFAKQHDIKVGTIADLIHYRIKHEQTVSRVNEQHIKTRFGEFLMVTYQDEIQQSLHVALVKGDIEEHEATLVRVTETELLRDLLGVDSAGRQRWSLSQAMQLIDKEGAGVVVILGTSAPTESVLDRLGVERDRSAASRPEASPYNIVGTGSQILRDLGVRKMRLMSPPIKYAGITGFDLEVVEYLKPEDHLLRD